MLVLRTMLAVLGVGALFSASVMFRNAPGLPPTSTWPPVLVPPPGVVNWVNAQSVSRNVLSDTVCAAAGVDSATTVAINDVSEASHANLALVERIIVFSRET